MRWRVVMYRSEGQELWSISLTDTGEAWADVMLSGAGGGVETSLGEASAHDGAPPERFLGFARNDNGARGADQDSKPALFLEILNALLRVNRMPENEALELLESGCFQGRGLLPAFKASRFHSKFKVWVRSPVFILLHRVASGWWWAAGKVMQPA